MKCKTCGSDQFTRVSWLSAKEIGPVEYDAVEQTWVATEPPTMDIKGREGGEVYCSNGHEQAIQLEDE